MAGVVVVLVGVLLLLIQGATAASPVAAATPVPSWCQTGVPPPDEDKYWKTVRILSTAKVSQRGPFTMCDIRPTSLSSDGLSIYAFDPAAGLANQLQFVGDTFRVTQLPKIADPIDPGEGVASRLVVGERGLYVVGTVHGDTEPKVRRIDRAGSTVRGDWRIRPGATNSAPLTAVSAAVDNGLWTLRADNAGPPSKLDRQAIETDLAENQPPQNVLTLDTTGAGAALAGSGLATIERPKTLIAPNPGQEAPVQGALYAIGGLGSETLVKRIPIVHGVAQSPTPEPAMKAPRVDAATTVQGSWLYAIGGNSGGATIERARIASDGALSGWQAMPEPPAGASIVNAVAGQAKLFIFRADGTVQRMSLTDNEPSRAKVAWGIGTQPQHVKRGDTVNLTVPWQYVGPQNLRGLTVTLTGSIADPGNKKSSTWVTVKPTTLGDVSAPLFATGQPLVLTGTVPRTLTASDGKQRPDRRTSLFAALQMRAIDDENIVYCNKSLNKPCTRGIGPMLYVRFLIKD